MKVTFKTGSEANYGSTNGELFFASDTKQLLLNGVKYIPKKLSELTNDRGFLTSITKSMVENVLTGNITSHTHNYIPLTDKGLSNGNVSYYVDFPKFSQLVSLGYNEESTMTDDEHYFKGLCKWAIDNYANQGIILLMGNAQPNSVGYCCIQLYAYNDKDANTGLPRYCSGIYNGLKKNILIFGCVEYTWYWKGSFGGNAATSSKWSNLRTITLTGSVTGSVSIDGSANVSLATTTNHTHSEYLPLTGGTLSGSLTCNGSWIEKSGSSGSNGFVGYFNTPKRADRAGSSHIFNSGWAYGNNAVSLGAAAYAGVRNTDSDSETYPYLHWQWMNCLQVQETTSGTAVNCYGAILTNAGGNKDTATFSLCIGDMCVAYGGANNSQELNNFLSFTNTNASTGRVVVYIADNKSGDSNERIFAGTTSRPKSQSNVKIGNLLLGQACNITDVVSMSINGVTVYRVAFYFWNKTLSSTYDITKKTTAMVCTKVNNTNYSGASSYASGAYSVASGRYSVASGDYSVASGFSSVASGAYSVASGFSSVASGYYSVASGFYSVASGFSSVASGFSSVASGYYSVAKHEGSKVYALRGVSGRAYQTVFGRDNVETSAASVVVGWGTSDAARKNIFVLDTAGNATFGDGGAATVTAATFKGALSGNATSATNATNAAKLQTPRTITVGGASEDFDGSKDISFDLSKIITNTSHINVGSISVTDSLTSNNVTINNHLELGTNADVSGLTPSKIGAAAASHTHTFSDLSGVAAASHTHLYAGSASAGGAATSAVKLNTARKLWGQSFDGTADIDGNITLSTSEISVSISRGIRDTSTSGFIGFRYPSKGDEDKFSGICLGWDNNPTSADASLRINESTFAYKGNTVWHGGNLKLGYTSSGLSRAVQKDSSNNLYVVAPSLFEQGISNNYPKNLRWITEDEGQLVFDTEETAGVPSTVQVSIPVANETSKGFMKSISSVTDVTGYTPCPVKSGTPYYKLDTIELDYTDFFEIGSGSIEDNLSITNPWITPIPIGGSLEYLLNYGVNNIPRLLTIDLGGYWKYFFWLQQTDDDTPIVAYYHCQFNDLWIVIDSPNREIRISRGGF